MPTVPGSARSPGSWLSSRTAPSVLSWQEVEVVASAATKRPRNSETNPSLTEHSALSVMRVFDRSLTSAANREPWCHMVPFMCRIASISTRGR